ncbi:MAG: transcription antitermination factor NusB [Phycisphaerales bacterium]|nr:transcription antitermination factor NusB [Phycisphaerales bacterium]
MASPRDIRKLALLALYQLDSRAGADAEAIRDSLNDVLTLEEEGLTFSDLKMDFSDAQRDRAFELAHRAFEHREIADVELNELSTDWTVSRMPVVDRSILRLAHYEMTVLDDAQPKAAVNEAVELAKVFSTKNSPGFINGILDKILKRVLAKNQSAGVE